MSGLIIFLHGLRGEPSDWRDVPIYVQSGLSSFETKSLSYSADIGSHADIESSATQILTTMKSSHGECDPIFIVGYSMGGLVAREVCLKLLKSEADAELLGRILGVITFGSPLSGLTRGWRQWAIERVKRALTQKVSQLTPEFVFGRYNTALAKALERGINGPKQIHYEIENDELAKRHDTKAYTRDDVHGGAIPGTHRGFLSLKEDEIYVADLVLKQILQRYSALGHAGRPPISVSKSHPADRILLIASSNRKRTSGKEFAGPVPASWIPQPEFRDQIKSKRTAVFGLLKDLNLTNGFLRANNRIHQAPNQVLKHGPDFGGIEKGGLYLPAWERYAGRCYAPIAEQSWKKHFRDTGQLSVLIMSGLYGWVDAAEWIQEYDVHLTDTNNETGVKVSALWTELFTETLVTYINSAFRNKKVKVFNFLCDNAYIDAVQWHKLPAGCSVYHLASPELAHEDLLPAAGTLIDFLLRCHDGLDTIERCTRDAWNEYPLTDFGTPPKDYVGTKILFEATVGESKKNPNFDIRNEQH